MKKACYRIGEILYWVLCLLLIANIDLCIFGIRPFVVVSGSMEPAIQTGSISWVNLRADADHLQQGDILAFERNDGELVLHRILRRTEAGIVTKGDANSVPDAGSGECEYPFEFTNVHQFLSPYHSITSVSLSVYPLEEAVPTDFSVKPSAVFVK